MTALHTVAAAAAHTNLIEGAGHAKTPRPAPLPVWVRVCATSDLESERGRAALIDGEQVALFTTHEGRIFAVQQLDPFSGAYVMARGIVGTRGDAPTVASPMYKQVFDLRTGTCLDTQGKDQKSLRTWPVSVDAAGDVYIKWEAAS